jgi:putative hydrolase of the HAD superfamily
MAEPTAVLFDAAETLIEMTPSLPELINRAATSAGAVTTQRRVREVMWELGRAGAWPDHEHDPDVRLSLWSQFCAEVIRRAGGVEPGAAAEDAARYLLHPRHYRAFADARPCLDRLRSAGLRLGMVSNFDSWLHGVLDETGLRQYLDVVVVSADVGLTKPEPAIFRLACQRLGHDPDRCVYVGDSVLSDVRGAAGAGLRPVLLDRAGRFPDYQDAKISTLDELVPSVLGRLALPR